MISILVPTYNYNIYALIQEVHKQLEAADIAYEIIVSDDHSSQYTEENKKTESLLHTTYITQEQNVGRTKNREILANTATYNWLLFLDADVLPATTSFIKNYVNAIQEDLDIIFGGISYQENPPSKDCYLRWYYGKHRESQSIKKRNQQPWFVISQNLLIKKNVFSKSKCE